MSPFWALRLQSGTDLRTPICSFSNFASDEKMKRSKTATRKTVFISTSQNWTKQKEENKIEEKMEEKVKRRERQQKREQKAKAKQKKCKKQNWKQEKESEVPATTDSGDKQTLRLTCSRARPQTFQVNLAAAWFSCVLRSRLFWVSAYVSLSRRVADLKLLCLYLSLVSTCSFAPCSMFSLFLSLFFLLFDCSVAFLVGFPLSLLQKNAVITQQHRPGSWSSAQRFDPQ